MVAYDNTGLMSAVRAAVAGFAPSAVLSGAPSSPVAAPPPQREQQSSIRVLAAAVARTNGHRNCYSFKARSADVDGKPDVPPTSVFRAAVESLNAARREASGSEGNIGAPSAGRKSPLADAVARTNERRGHHGDR